MIFWAWYIVSRSHSWCSGVSLSMHMSTYLNIWFMMSTSSSATQMQWLESVQERLIKRSTGLSRRSHNAALLKALCIERVDDIVNRNVLSLCSRLFKVESPVRRLMQHLLSRVIVYGVTVPGTLLDRLVSMGESPTKLGFSSQYVPEISVPNNDSLVD